MSLPLIILGGYLVALSVVLLLATSLGRVAKAADKREARLRRAEAHRRTAHSPASPADAQRVCVVNPSAASKRPRARA